MGFDALRLPRLDALVCNAGINGVPKWGQYTAGGAVGLLKLERLGVGGLIVGYSLGLRGIVY